jgi:IS30 family transposase
MTENPLTDKEKDKMIRLKKEYGLTNKMLASRFNVGLSTVVRELKINR